MTDPDKRRQDPTRVRYPKVKTGCITCRNRRVKCDETRPSCLRCRKYGTECGGYLPGRRRPPSSAYGSFATQARALVPKDHSSAQIILQPAMSLFETDLEHRYFRLFSDHIATEICPYFNPESWSRMILQACATEASIRHAAVAIGALGKTYEIAQAGLCSVTGQKFPSTLGPLPAPRVSIENRSVEEIVASANLVTEAHEHHRTALEQYDKAIKRIQNDMSSGDQTPLRTTLLICIVIICFEAIHGNHISAAAQLQSGLALVQEWMSKQPDARHHPQGFSSPAPDEVEDYLVQTFGRMEIQSMSVFDPRPVETHQALKGEGKQEVQQMPTPFASVEQARVYLDLITRRLMHYNHSIHPRGGQRKLPPQQIPMPWANQSVPQPMPWIDGKIPLPNTTSTLSSADIHAEQASLTQELTTWTEAFAPLLSLSRTLGGQDAISALTLSVSAITSQISLRAAFFINESAYDVFLPDFKTIVQYSSLLLSLLEQQFFKPSPPFAPTASSPSSSHSPQKEASERTERGLALRFSFDIAVVPSLYTVVIKCRDPHIRRAALKLLDRYPRREGVWDSVAVAGLGRWVMALEEEGALRWQSASPPDTTTTSTSPRPIPESTSNPNPKSKSNPTHPAPGSGSGFRHASPASTPLSRHETPPGTSTSREGSYSNGTRASEKPPREYPIIPEEMRVRKAAMRFDLLARRANMSCMQMDFKSGDFVEKTEVFRW